MTTKITEQNISQLANAGVNWQSVFTGDGSTGLTAVAGRGYFIDTTSGTVTVTLPASPSAGDVVVLKDYARTWGTNAVTIASVLTDGNTTENTFSTNGQTVTLVYMDGTKGWSLINEDTTTGLNTTYITATGGTITTSGDFKIHTFTGDGCFVVSQVGAGDGPSVVDYLVVAGGGGGGGSDTVNTAGGGGGAGGFRESKDSTVSSPHTVSPLAATTGLTITTTTYPVTVGAGGTGSTGYNTVPCAAKGSNSVFSTITSTGGGGGKAYNSGFPANANGGSGGGGGGQSQSPGDNSTFGQSGNTPPVSPPQGNAGGNGDPSATTSTAGGGGGGATAVGSNNNPPTGGGPGGAGATTSISGSPTAYAGGGGGGNGTAPGGVGGGGAGANGGPGSTATAGTANTGGGGGGTATLSSPPAGTGGNGGKGIVIIRYKYQ